MPRIIYAKQYNIGFYGFERLHPFDSRKYGRVWKRLRTHFGRSVQKLHINPGRPISREETLSVHSAQYLQQLTDPEYLAAALEVPQLTMLPGTVIDSHVLSPMRWATAGSVQAGRAAIEHGLAINLGGGFHHAKPDRGEGFCIYSDIAITVQQLRAEQRLTPASRIVYIDTDAHQGNGVCHCFRHDHSLFIFDIYNASTYPRHDVEARQRIDCDIPVPPNCSDDDYLSQLQRQLPGFLDSLNSTPIELAIYNAGTDIYSGDWVGGLDVSAAGIKKRDLFVVDQLRSRNIPTMMLLSGGYTKESYQLVANSVIAMLEANSGTT